MAFTIKPVDVYAGDILNRPGMLARILEALSLAGADLHFVIARRITERTCRVFVAPLKGARQLRAAADVGLMKTQGLHVLAVSGPNKPGLGAQLTRAMAAAGLNLRGLSAAATGRQSVCYIALATPEEARQAAGILRKALRGRPARAR